MKPTKIIEIIKPAVPVKPKHYVDNNEFERLLILYRKKKDPVARERLTYIMIKIAESVYYLAVRNIFNNIKPGNFPTPNYHDRQDLIQQALQSQVNALNYWQPRHKIKKVKSKAFNYFTCCAIYAIQNELKKELRKGWYKSQVLSKKFLTNYINKFGIQIYVDWDERKKTENEYDNY
jgi:hypothetical protein